MIFVGEVCPFSSGSWDSSEITGKNQAPDTGHGLALVSMNNSGLNNAIGIYCRSVFDAINENDVSLIRFYNYEL